MDERSEPMDDEAWFQELERRAREAGTDLFSQFFNDVLAGSGAEAKRKTLAGEWTEEELEVFAQARERKLKFINKLDALTPIEKQYLLQNTEYVIAETVEEFLRDQRDQDDMTEMPPVELAQLAESARTKLYEAQKVQSALRIKFFEENRELFREAVKEGNPKKYWEAFNHWKQNR